MIARAQRFDYGNSIGILFERTDDRGQRWVVKPMPMKWIPADGHYNIEPSISIQPECAKSLTQALSNLGMPTENESVVKGKLEATQYHLEDMRKLVLTQLNIATKGGRRARG